MQSTRGEALTTTSVPIGFRSKTTIDQSDEMLRHVKLVVARAKQGDREAVRFLYVEYSRTSTATSARSSMTSTRPRT